MDIYKNLPEWIHDIENLMGPKKRYAFNLKTLWQLDFEVPRISVLFLAFLSRFKKNSIEIKKQSA